VKLDDGGQGSFHNAHKRVIVHDTMIYFENALLLPINRVFASSSLYWDEDEVASCSFQFYDNGHSKRNKEEGEVRTSRVSPILFPSATHTLAGSFAGLALAWLQMQRKHREAIITAGR